jgi:hypothetical protein
LNFANASALISGSSRNFKRLKEVHNAPELMAGLFLMTQTNMHQQSSN